MIFPKLLSSQYPTLTKFLACSRIPNPILDKKELRATVAGVNVQLVGASTVRATCIFKWFEDEIVIICNIQLLILWTQKSFSYVCIFSF